MNQEKIDYEKLGSEIGKLITTKQKAYGDSFHKSSEVMKQLYPNGIPVSNYVDVLAIVRIIDKLFRLATDPNWGGESPWGDIAGYSLLRLGDVNKKNERLPKKEEWKVVDSGVRPAKGTDWYDFNNPELRDSGIG